MIFFPILETRLVNSIKTESEKASLTDWQAADFPREYFEKRPVAACPGSHLVLPHTYLICANKRLYYKYINQLKSQGAEQKDKLHKIIVEYQVSFCIKICVKVAILFVCLFHNN
jgi:hypothetical protein